MPKQKHAKWSTLRKHIQAQGGRSDGLYNVPILSILRDTPQIGETKVIPIYFEVPHAKF